MFFKGISCDIILFILDEDGRICEDCITFRLSLKKVSTATTTATVTTAKNPTIVESHNKK